ncbi:MAG: hypothetical protein QM817_35985 [Archangium sp.]
MNQRLVLFAIAAVSFIACSECSDRQQRDLMTERELDDALANNFAPSFDAGVALLAKLEIDLAPAIEVTPQRLAELADASIDDIRIENNEVRGVRVADRSTARALIASLHARRIDVLWIRELDGGVLDIDVELLDRALLTSTSVFPTWLPDSSDGYPCLSDCKARIDRIVEKRALLTQFTTSLDRLRQLRRTQKWVDDVAKRAPTPEARALLDRVLAAELPAGTLIHSHSEVKTANSVTVCGSGLSIAACEQGFDAGCMIADVCPVGRRCVNAEDCGVIITP